jgi:hypothetical protein
MNRTSFSPGPPVEKAWEEQGERDCCTLLEKIIGYHPRIAAARTGFEKKIDCSTG